MDIAMNPTQYIKEPDRIFLDQSLSSLIKGIPIQYIIGVTEFYGLPFKVSPAVLIPRPETEELVSWILKEVDSTANLNILEIGTGSGCIAISLAKHLPNANVIAVDISKSAIRIAEENASLNKVKITLLEKNILIDANFTQQFDLIVSNPPYVCATEKNNMHKNVLENEPHLALFVEDDKPLLFYEKIIELAKDNLEKDGNIFVEINQYLTTETLDLFTTNDLNPVLKKDINGNPRMIRAQFHG